MGSSATVARAIGSSTTRSFLEASINKLRPLASLDLGFSPIASWFKAGLAVSPRADEEISTRDLPCLVAAQADGDGHGYASGFKDGHGSRTGTCFLYFQVPNRSIFPAALRPACAPTTFPYFPVATRPRASVIPAPGNDACGRFIFTVVINRPGLLRSFRPPICTGPLFGPKTTTPSLFCSPLSFRVGRRHASNWAWTPWEPNRPKDKQTLKQEVDSLIKQVADVKLSPEEELQLKKAFIDRFYPTNMVDPSSVQMMFDFIAVKLDELPAKFIEAQNKTKGEWGTFKFFGRKFDFSKVVSFLGLFFKA